MKSAGAAAPPPGGATARSAGKAAASAAGATGDVVQAVGAELRRLRRGQGLSLQEVARRAGLSVGYLSQVERGLSPLSVKALQDLAGVFGKPIGWFFRDDDPDAAGEERDTIVRRPQRKRIDHIGIGISDQLLSPHLDGKLEFLLSEFEPGASSGREPYSHEGEECGLLIKGQLELWVGERYFFLRSGDSFAFPSTEPHRYRNPGRGKTVVVWAITPPSF